MQITPSHFLDATLPEEASTSLRLLLMFSFPELSNTKLQGMRTCGAGELTSNQLSELVQVCFRFPVPSCFDTLSDMTLLHRQAKNTLAKSGMV